MSRSFAHKYRSEGTYAPRVAGDTFPLHRLAVRACALLVVLSVFAIGARTATAAVTHQRLQVAMQRYGTCRSGFTAVSGESATEGRAVLYADLFGTAVLWHRPILQVYAGDQRQDPDGRHIEWTSRNGSRVIIAGFSHLRQVAGILNHLRAGMACR